MAQVYTARYGLSRPHTARYRSAVEQDSEWPSRLTAAIGKRLAYYRERIPGEGKGGRMSAQALSDRCAALNHPIDRSVIAKLEKGLRQAITVADVLVLAKALGVPPVALVFPVATGRDEPIEVLPGREVSAWEGTKWFTGEEPYPNRGQTDEEAEGDWRAWNANGRVLNLFRNQERLAFEWAEAKLLARNLRRRADEEALDDDQRATYLRDAAVAEERARLLEPQLQIDRKSLREMGVDPGELPPDLAHVDTPDAGRIRTPPRAAQRTANVSDEKGGEAGGRSDQEG